MEDVANVFMIFAGVFLVILIFILYGYILSGIGLSRMAKTVGIKDHWLAWLPAANMFIVGELAGPITLFGHKFESFGVPMVIISVATTVLGVIPIFGWLLLIAYQVLFFIVIHHVYKRFNPGKAVFYTLLSIFCVILIPVLFFLLRNKVPADISNSGNQILDSPKGM